MYPNHYNGTNNSRVRNVPIQVERRDDIGKDASTSPEPHRQYQTRQQRHGRFQNDHQQSHRHEPYYYEPSNRQNNQQDSHTTSVDIKHQAPDARLRQQLQQQQQQHHQRQTSQDDSQSSDGSDKVDRTRVNTNTELRSQEQNPQANQEDKGLKHSSSFDLPLVDRSTPIPMPPPPEPRPAHIGQDNDENKQHHQPQEQRQQQSPMQNGMNMIADAKAEAKELLNEVLACDETSLQSKKYLYLHEHLERCILKLDNVQVPELRPHRKAAVEMVQKCLDILKRKVELNHDIHQIAAKSS